MGYGDDQNESRKGRLKETDAYESQMYRLGRPYGTGNRRGCDPPINRWAIDGRPYGTGNRRGRDPPINRWAIDGRPYRTLGFGSWKCPNS